MSKPSPFKEIDGVMYRKCNKCQEYKIFDEFNKNKSGVFGIQNTCKICANEYYDQNKEKVNKRVKNYREQNKEKIKEKQKEYREQNKEKIKEYSKEHYEQNKEKVKEKVKEYQEKNKEKVKGYKRKYHEKNKDRENNRRKEYRDNIKNKYGVSENTLRRKKDENFRLQHNLRISNYKNLKRALEYYNNGKSDKLPSKSPSRLLLKLYEIQNHNCPYCSNNMKDNIHIDHIIPLSKNGNNEVHNLILCCSSCNLRKNAKELDIWLEECNINYDEFISNIERRNEVYFSE